MGVALYRKYRSRRLADIVGQEHVTELLASAIKSNRLAHAYLFTGPRGVGKTSIARILAHEINDLEYNDDSVHLDIIEIDAASNNGVEDIRDLRERVQIAPVSARKKVYIIDEVHMLSKPAFNALLKTLEEPPEHVVFILATTDIDKVPQTIISRTQRHTFRRASEKDIIKNLQRIASEENITASENALKLIAKHSDGSFRDSVSLFDQLSSGAGEQGVTTELVISSLGLVEENVIEALIEATAQGNLEAVNQSLLELETAGAAPRVIAKQLMVTLRHHLATTPAYSSLINELLEVSKSNYPELKLLTVLSLHAPNSVQTMPAQARPQTTPPKKSVATPVATPVQKPLVKPAPKPDQKEPTPKPQKIKKNVTSSSQGFDWQKLLEYVRTHHIALHSVLSKCDAEIADGELVLYTKSAFYKKKLDDSKYKGLLNDSLAELGYEFEIEIMATAKPLKDSQAAKVAAMMGGGEEVSVDDA